MRTLIFTTIKLCTEFEMPIFTRSMKEDPKRKIAGDQVTQSHQHCYRLMDHIRLPIHLITGPPNGSVLFCSLLSFGVCHLRL